MEKNKKMDNINPENQEMVKGVISEEALDTIAAGMDSGMREALNTLLVAAGVVVVSSSFMLTCMHACNLVAYKNGASDMSEELVDHFSEKSYDLGYQTGKEKAKEILSNKSQQEQLIRKNNL